MKGFLGNFAICLVVCLVGTFLFAGLLAQSVWASAVCTALVMAICITAHVGQTTRIEALEKRIEQLEGQKEAPKEAHEA